MTKLPNLFTNKKNEAKSMYDMVDHIRLEVCMQIMYLQGR